MTCGCNGNRGYFVPTGESFMLVDYKYYGLDVWFDKQTREIFAIAKSFDEAEAAAKQCSMEGLFGMLSLRHRLGAPNKKAAVITPELEKSFWDQSEASVNGRFTLSPPTDLGIIFHNPDNREYRSGDLSPELLEKVHGTYNLNIKGLNGIRAYHLATSQAEIEYIRGYKTRVRSKYLNKKYYGSDGWKDENGIIYAIATRTKHNRLYRKKVPADAQELTINDVSADLRVRIRDWYTLSLYQFERIVAFKVS